MATLKEDRWLRDRDIFIAKAKQIGYDVIVKMPTTTANFSLQVEDMIASGIDVLVIAPHDSIDAKMCDGQKVGIPVLTTGL